jgi:hypothetical protein
MKTVNSLSGGKTSSYMAAHFKADYDIFALVRIEAEYCKPKDQSLVKYVSDKIGMEFVATAESDKTLYVVRDLEQLIGREIKWVTRDTFDEVIRKRKALPNMMWRFCTTEMKLKPIFDWWMNNFSPEMVSMSIGYRFDEMERGFEKVDGIWQKKEEKPFKHIIGKSDNGRNRWGETMWRDTVYPLVGERITHYEVNQWARSTGLVFPDDSNCVGCFWKQFPQIRKNWDDEPLKMRWFAEVEKKMGRTFKKEMDYFKAKRLGVQQDFIFGGGAGCQAGYCTD